VRKWGERLLSLNDGAESIEQSHVVSPG